MRVSKSKRLALEVQVQVQVKSKSKTKSKFKSKKIRHRYRYRQSIANKQPLPYCSSRKEMSAREEIVRLYVLNCLAQLAGVVLRLVLALALMLVLVPDRA